jgi:hypothetical protein
MLNTVFELKKYVGRQTLDDIAQQMLTDDEVRRDWQRALADPAFATDPRARYLWWYARTPYRDEQLGLLPTLRVMARPEFAATPVP